MEAKPEESKPGSPRLVDLNKLANTPGYKVAIKTPDPLEELQSRLKIAESEAEHRLRTEEAEDAFRRKISLMVHVCVMTVVVIAFLASVYIAMAKDPKTGLPDKAMGIITAIVAAGVGYMTGKGSK